MPEIIIAERYVHFMKWFSYNHPQLYKKYRLHILISEDSFLIRVSMDYVEPEDKIYLLNAISKYNATGVF